ncbi:MAG: hypothetical protein CJBNEKGG_03451 [Prosthecobacter sp.]|nr:hypothetical protein [Prosthecobacter sp.]
MNSFRLPLSLLLALSILPGCKPAPDTAAEESRRLLEQAREENARQAEEIQQRSSDLQQQLADLQKALQEKETAELKARLEAIRLENERLAADAEAARRKSLSLTEELERSRLPKALPYVPPQAPAAPRQPWMSPEDDYSLFYDSLRPHGRWLEVDGYGYAFRPGLADRPGWRPYVDGRWAWTDQGWAWDSNEPFGWACYHYGRWVQVSRHGWLWVPGREWAPAWVSWRYGDDCVGWAPLPPGAGRTGVGHDCDVRYGLGPSSYTFINATHFSRTSYVNVSLSITSITRIFKNTLNVTSIVPSSRGSIFTQRGGPALDWVERRCGSPVMRAPVSFKDRLDRAPDLRRDREHGRPGFHAAPLEIVRGKSRPGIPPIAERIQKPVMLDSWKDVPENRRADLREAMLRQAQLPQPRPALADTPRPAEPTLPRQPETSSPDTPDTPVAGIPGQTRPQPPGGGLPQGDDRHGPSAGPGRRPGFPGGDNGGQARHEPGMNRQDAPQPGSIVEQGRPRQSGNKPGVEQPPLTSKTDPTAAEAAAMKAREEEAARLQQELARRQAAMEAQQARAAEQERQNQGRREMQSRMERQRQEMEKSRQEKLAEESRTREMQFRRHQEEMAAKQAEAEARKRQQEAAMAAQQQAAAQLEQRQAEAMKVREEASRREAEMQERRGREAQEAAMKAQQEAAERQREAAERAQQEAAMRAAQEAAERAQREAAERAQREAMERAQQEAAMRAAQEAAERQREAAERAQREAMERAQQEAAMRAAQEAAERAQREAMERAQREAAERQREMQRQQEEARRQAEEAARRQAEEAARRAAEEAAKQQGQ